MKEKLQMIGSVIVCPTAIIIRDSLILCGYRHYEVDKKNTISVWTTPGGRCDAGETIEETLRREIEEETNITDLHILRYLTDVSGAKEGDIVPIFLCSTSQEARLMEPEKFSEWKWFDLGNLPDDFINNRVKAEIIKLLS